MYRTYQTYWAIISLLILLVSTKTAAQCLDWMDGLERDEWGADQAVTSVVEGEYNGTQVAFIGGYYSWIGGIRSKGLVAWYGQNWTAIDDWFSGEVYELAWFDDGNGYALYCMGNFELEEGGPQAQVLRYRDGQWDDLHAQIGNSRINTATVYDGKLFIGGWFTSIAGEQTNRLAAWNGTSWEAFPDGPDDFNASIDAMVSYDDGSGPSLIVGGSFSHAGGTPVSNVASYKNGTWSAMGAGFSGGTCTSLCMVPFGSQSILYAGGDFDWTGSDRVNNIAKWNGVGWEQLGGNGHDGGGVTGRVYALAVHPGSFSSVLVVMGIFGGFNGGLPLRNAAVWDGFGWDDLRGGIGNSSNSLMTVGSVHTAFGQRLIFGGDIVDQGGKPANKIAIWGVPCTIPTIVRSPTDQTASFNDPVIFDAHAHGTLPIDYVWTHNGVPLIDNERIFGADSDHLVIFPWIGTDEGVYECEVSNQFGTELSDPAVLTIPGGGLPSVPIDTLTLTTIESPDDPDISLNLYAKSVASDHGIAIEGYYTNSYKYIMQWKNGALEVIAKLGDPLPSARLDDPLTGPYKGEIFSEFTHYLLAGPGDRLAFTARISGPDVTQENDTVLCLFDGIELRTILREGDQASGMNAGVTVSDIDPISTSMVFGEQQTLLITNRIQGNDFDPNVDSAVWSYSANSILNLHAHSQQIAPGGEVPWISLSGNFASDPVERIVLTGWVDSMTGYKNRPGPDQGFWIEQTDGFGAVVKSGDYAPGFPSDVNFEYFNTSAISSDQFIFSSRVAGPNGFDSFGLWTWNGSTTEQILLEGDPLPDGPPDLPPNAYFIWPDYLQVNSNNALLFSSSFASDCTNDCPSHGLFLRLPSGELQNIIIHDMPAIEGMGSDMVIIGSPTFSINNRNQIIIEAGFRQFNSVAGLLGWDPLHGLFPLIVPGTRIEIEPNIPSVVLNAVLSRPDFPDPQDASGLTKDGTVIAAVEFTEGSGALVKTNWTEARDAYFPCRADLNEDGIINTHDLITFLNMWVDKQWGTDYNTDGQINTNDMIAYINDWVAGC